MTIPSQYVAAAIASLGIAMAALVPLITIPATIAGAAIPALA